MQKWLRGLAIASLLGFPLAVIGTRTSLFDFKIGILMVAASFLLALFVFLISAFCLLKRKAIEPKSLKFTLLLSLFPVIGIGSVLFGAADVPKIHNISTDVVDPPSFNKIAEIRTTEHNSLEYNIDELAEVQQAAYPEVKTFETDMTQQSAQARAVELVETLGWDLIDNDIENGIIEASDTSRLWGFTDDIVIRLQSNSASDMTAIDLRSVSRVGQSDLGVNAKRIQRFISEFKQE